MAITNQKQKKGNKAKLMGVIDPDEVDDAKDSYFTKKNNEAKTFLRKVGLPKVYYKQVSKKQ